MPFTCGSVKGASLRYVVNEETFNQVTPWDIRHHQMTTNNKECFHTTLTTIPTLNWGRGEKKTTSSK